MSFINIGYGNIVNSQKVISIVSPDAAVVVMENNTIILSSLLPETIASRMNMEEKQ